MVDKLVALKMEEFEISMYGDKATRMQKTFREGDGQVRLPKEETSQQQKQKKDMVNVADEKSRVTLSSVKCVSGEANIRARTQEDTLANVKEYHEVAEMRERQNTEEEAGPENERDISIDVETQLEEEVKKTSVREEMADMGNVSAAANIEKEIKLLATNKDIDPMNWTRQAELQAEVKVGESDTVSSQEAKTTVDEVIEEDPEAIDGGLINQLIGYLNTKVEQYLRKEFVASLEREKGRSNIICRIPVRTIGAVEEERRAHIIRAELWRKSCLSRWRMWEKRKREKRALREAEIRRTHRACAAQWPTFTRALGLLSGIQGVWYCSWE